MYASNGLKVTVIYPTANHVKHGIILDTPPHANNESVTWNYTQIPPPHTNNVSVTWDGNTKKKKLHYDKKFQIFIFLIGYINIIKGVFLFNYQLFMNKKLQCIELYQLFN